MKYNYKCVLSNGNKRYYKNINGKWKRITNKVGAKAQRGKRTYRMEAEGSSSEGIPDITDTQYTEFREKVMGEIYGEDLIIDNKIVSIG